jgi:hypothetical protein
LQTLEAQIKVLSAKAEKNQEVEDALKAQLATAQNDRYPSLVVGFLAAMLLCALVAAAYFGVRWRLAREGVERDWWRVKVGRDSGQSDFGVVDLAKRTAVRSNDRNPLEGRQSAETTTGEDLTGLDALYEKLSAKPSATISSLREEEPKNGFFQNSMSTRSVNVEELFDIEQQAEFFVSIGQHDQAIALLQQHIDGAFGTSGLAYLDLLALYHQFDRRDDYNRLRMEFNQGFNARVPPFDQYEQKSRGIERYESISKQLTAHWNGAKILDVLNNLIFRKSGIQGQECEAFDLMAYRELMMLFAVAKDLAEGLPLLGSSKTALATVEGATAIDRSGTGRSGIGISAIAKSEVAIVSKTGTRQPVRTRSTEFSPSVLSEISSNSPPHGTPLMSGLAALSSPLPLDSSAGFLDHLYDTLTTKTARAVSLPRASARLGLDVDLFAMEDPMSLEVQIAKERPQRDDQGLSFTLSERGNLTQAAPSLSPSSLPSHGVDLDIGMYLKDEKEFLSSLSSFNRKDY